MSLYKSNRWANEAKDSIDHIMLSYEETERELTERIDELIAELTELRAELRDVREQLADAQSELSSIAEPTDPTSPFSN